MGGVREGGGERGGGGRREGGRGGGRRGEYLIRLCLLLFLVLFGGEVAVVEAHRSVAVEVHGNLLPNAGRQTPLRRLLKN